MTNSIVIGDLILDKFSYGSVKRVNPEGPNPLLDIEYDGNGWREENRLGGAANVAANLSGLQGKTNLIGFLGDDSNGFEFKKLCEQHNINLYSLLNGCPTITKQRFIENTYKQQMLRVDYEQKYTLTREHKNQIMRFLGDLSPEFITISDYNKGIIDRELVEMIKELGKNNNIKIFVDTKPKNINFFQGIYLLKPNLKEFREMVGKDVENNDDQIEEYGKQFVESNNFNLVITRGSKGASLITTDGKYFSLPIQAKNVFDVTGAGDTFLATIVYGLSIGFSLEESVKLANKASGIVVGKVGTATITKDELFI